MPKPDRKGRKGGKEMKGKEGRISYLLYYSHLWCEIAA